jgi:hypothetical protein
MGHRWMLSGLKGRDTVVVLYFDYRHWTFFVLEDSKTYHFGAVMDVHDNMWADDYVTLLHIAWATALAKNLGHADWWRIVARGVLKYIWDGDYTNWKCGYVMAYMSWQYVKRRAAAKATRLLKEFKFGSCTGRDLQVWFQGVLHHELICRDTRFSRERLTTLKEDDMYLTVTDIPVKCDFAVVNDDGSRYYGLNFLTEVRPLIDYSFSRPANLASEDSGVRDRRQAKEKEDRNSRRANLKEWAGNAQK